MLVSHWSVGSDAAVKLTTRAFAELKEHPEIGRAEAMRRSMLALIDQGKPYEAHPAYWAPFVVVGEGGATSMAVVPVAAPVAAPSPTTTGALSATPEEPNSKAGNAPVPSAEPVVAPAAPGTDAAPGATSQLPPKASTLPKDKQASKTKVGAPKKARSKPKPDDWITSIFGQ